MDIHVLVFEARREIGRAYQARDRGRDALDHLLSADRRLVRLSEYARRKAGEAAGITYISPGQTVLFDGCGPDGRSA